MHVIGHDRPGQQAISLIVEMFQRISNKLRDDRHAQPTLARPGIKEAVDALRMQTV